MTLLKATISIALTMALLSTTLIGQKPNGGDPDLARKIARFAPTTLTADTSKLTPKDKQALDKIIAAAKLLDPLFLRQVWSGNDALEKKLQADKSATGQQRLHYFYINDGPWSRLDEKEPFIDGVPREKPLNASYYPDDMSKDEFNSWVQTLSDTDKQKATGFFWLIRRGADRKLTIVPYSEAYKEYLGPAAALLREAAALTTNATLKNFLNKRADAFGSDDYYESDVAWMDLDSPIDVTFGPYETYEDELFSYKAAFESYVTLRDDAETQSSRSSVVTCRSSKTIFPSIRSTGIQSSAPLRRYASSMKSSRRVRATAACKRRRSIFRTTSES